jgi:GTP pyrophosphokinase
MKPESRKRISEETLDIYAPLAARMGMEKLREELEDNAFRWLHPDAYKAVTAKLAELRKSNEGLVEEIRAALAAKLAEVGIDAEVSGREKKPYAIWRKMANKQISLEQLSDIYAFRVITKSIDDCYRVLGVAHTTWRTVPGRFKDYISTPKQNNYQSIHTTIVGPRHQRVELQIRTRVMHDIAEYGVAAHAVYKESGVNGNAAARTSNEFEKGSGPYVWLRRLVETLLEGSNPEEFLEHTKLELFQDQVFCFSPKGRLIALPHGATPLDFAYAVHTDVGNAAVGAFVNGRHVPIDSKLRNGDEVEIETAKNHTPPAAWENFVVTGRARSAIRRAARDAVRRQYSELGRRLTAAHVERLGEELTDEALKRALPRLGYKSMEDALAAVGRNELSIENMLKAAFPEAVAPPPGKPAYRRTRRFGRAKGQDGWFNIDRVMSLKFRGGDTEQKGSGLAIRGINADLPVSFEPGGAVPGDRIVGVMIPGEGIRIFQIHSPRLREYEHEGWIDVTWDVDGDTQQRFPARISVTALNEPGTLAQIAKVIGESGGNIDNVRMLRRASDFTEMRIELEVLDLVHLNHIISGLREKAVVNKVERVFD